MNPSLPEETLRRLANLKYERELQSKEFPLSCLLTLYAASPRLLYLDYFAGLKELIAWLSPISRSTKQSMYIPIYLNTYECQRIGELLGEHPSVIWQELYDLTFKKDCENSNEKAN